MRHYSQDDQGRKTFKHRSHTGQGEFMLVGTGKNAYLWVGDKDGKFAGTLSGASLRQMAEQILAGNPFDDQVKGES